MTGIIREVNIGDCRLILGDCLQVMGEISGKYKLISDPPYEENLHKAKSKGRKLKRPDGSLVAGDLDFASIDEIRPEFMQLAENLCEGWFIVFCTIEGARAWADVINPSRMNYKRACVWIKPDSTPQMNGQGPAQGAECFVCAWAGGGFAKWNAGGKRGVYTHPVNPPSRDGRHPTEKPVSLMAEILTDFTNPGEVILDPFMGSGTIGVACLKTGRQFVGIERDEKYFDIACQRIAAAHSQPDFLLPLDVGARSNRRAQMKLENLGVG